MGNTGGTAEHVTDGMARAFLHAAWRTRPQHQERTLDSAAEPALPVRAACPRRQSCRRRNRIGRYKLAGADPNFVQYEKRWGRPS